MLAFLLLLAGVTDGMWQEAKPVYERTIAHPFLRELAEGTLAPARRLGSVGSLRRILAMARGRAAQAM
ncbi:MAG: hypothetical protein ACK5TN_14970 [Acidobacteriota bacterium]